MNNKDDFSSRADLHVHTTASDGTCTPSEVVKMAHDLRLGAIGICDHDTIGGLAEGLSAGADMGVMVVPGIEINTDYGKSEMHILGYFIDTESPALNAALSRIRSARLERGQRMVSQLKNVGINISMDRVNELANGATIGRPHVARALVEAGYSQSVNSAFSKYLVRGMPGYVERYKLSPAEAIGIIVNAGGTPVIAHPGNSRRDELIPELVNAGLKGLEVYHPDHSPYQTEHYKGLAEKYGLLATGGSDYHGPNAMHNITIAAATCDVNVVELIRNRAYSCHRI